MPKFVVLAACSSASVAAEIAPYASMVAATGNLDVRAWKRWSSIFYALLANGVPLSRAFTVAQAVDSLPVAMILQHDIALAAPRSIPRNAEDG